MKELAQITICLIPKGFKPEDFDDKDSIQNQKSYYGYEEHKWILPKDHFDWETKSFTVDCWSMRVEPLGESIRDGLTALEIAINGNEYNDFEHYFDSILSDAKSVAKEGDTKNRPVVVKFVGLFDYVSGYDSSSEGDEFWYEVEYLGRVVQQDVDANYR